MADVTETDPRLLEILKSAGDEWGPLGVAIAAAALTDPDVLTKHLLGEARLPREEDAPAEPRPGRRARVEVKGFRDLGVVRVTETTLAGEPMLHAECDDGSSADFPPSSLHFITWLPDGALEGMARAALPVSAGGFDSRYEAGDDDYADEDEPDDETERLPF